MSSETARKTAARIDALEIAEKRLLQDAAVIGHDVPFALLLAICGMEEDEVRGLIGNLQVSEFLYTTQLFPDLQFTFKHSLTHDVAYAGLRHERRREMHQRVVEKMERLYADRIDEQVERLAGGGACARDSRSASSRYYRCRPSADVRVMANG